MSRKQFTKSGATQQILRKQNTQLRQQLTQLKELLNINKKALKASLDYSKEGEHPHRKLIDQLYRQNDYLKEILLQRQGEIDQANSKVLISQKMVEASQDYQRSLIDELKGVISSLRAQIRQREARISELQKARPQFDSENMLHIRIVGISDPQSITVKMHDDMEALRQALQSKEQQLEKQRQNRQELYKLNLTLTKQINQMKSYGCDRSTNSKQPPPKSHKDLGSFLQYQKKIYDESESQESQMDSSQGSMSPAQQRQQPKKGGKPIPKLQLRKAKQIQQIIVKRITIEDKKKNKGHQSAQKQEQMAIIRKNLNRQLLRNVVLSRQVDKLTRLLKQAQSRNHLLISRSQKQQVASRLEESCNQPTYIRDALALGRQVYLNQIIDDVVSGQSVPTVQVGRSKSQ